MPESLRDWGRNVDYPGIAMSRPFAQLKGRECIQMDESNSDGFNKDGGFAAQFITAFAQAEASW